MPPLPADKFNQLALEHLDTLYRVARKLARTPEDAEELVQETYLKALRSRDGFELQEFGIRPWLLRILQNTYFTRWKRQKLAPSSAERDQIEAIAQTQSQLDVKFDFDLLDDELAGAVQQLPEEYRLPLLLWGVEDLSYKEIAAALDVPIGTVMSRLYRARQRLTESLKDYARSRGIKAE